MSRWKIVVSTSQKNNVREREINFTVDVYIGACFFLCFQYSIEKKNLNGWLSIFLQGCYEHGLGTVQQGKPKHFFSSYIYSLLINWSFVFKYKTSIESAIRQKHSAIPADFELKPVIARHMEACGTIHDYKVKGSIRCCHNRVFHTNILGCFTRQLLRQNLLSDRCSTDVRTWPKTTWAAAGTWNFSWRYADIISWGIIQSFSELFATFHRWL